jgi:hypothetical protein
MELPYATAAGSTTITPATQLLHCNIYTGKIVTRKDYWLPKPCTPASLDRSR